MKPGERGTARPPAAKAPVAEARGLAIGWRGRPDRVVAGPMDLELGAGELTVIVGPNGAGKSTLIRTLAGLQRPLGGYAAIRGEDTRGISVEDRSRLLACVLTDRYDSGFFSVRDVVAFGRYPHTGARGTLGDADIAAVEAAIEAVGLAPFAGRRFSDISDGERQKALIARGIAQACPLLLLDEPSAFLDAPARAWIFHLLRDLARSGGGAIVMSAHDIDLALRYADRMWLMDGRGGISAGAPEDLVASGELGRAFEGGELGFDERSGSFRARPATRPRLVRLLGPEGTSLAWTARLLERLGLAAATEPGGASATIRVEEGEAGPRFEVETPRGSARAGSFEELARALTALLPRGD
jgi:iron complex transport system ATP-binding protein